MNDDLFQLIKQLDKNEKGYFKKLAARYGEKSAVSDYMKLFDVIDKMSAYDEDKIKKQFSNSGKKINLSLQKNYLHEQIIRALRSYSSGKNTSYSLTERLLDIQNMMDKNLNTHAAELITVSLKKAEQSENFEMQLHLKMIQDNLMIRNIGRHSGEELLQVKNEIQELTDKIKREQLLNLLLFQLKLVDDERGKEEVLSDKTLQKAKAIIQNPVFENAEQLSKRGKLQVYAAHHIYYSLTNNDEEAYRYMKLRHELYKDMELDIRTTYNYLANVSNIILISLNLNKRNDASHFLKELESTHYRDAAVEKYRNQVYAKGLLMYLMVNTLHGITGKEVFDAEEKYLSTSPEALGNNSMMSAYYLSILFYYVKETDKALQWFNKTLEHKNTSFTNVQAYCRIIIAIIHYEQNNLSLMISSFTSAQYFMKKNNLTSAYLKTCIQLLTKLSSLSSKAERTAHLKIMLETINRLHQKDLKDEVTYFHDFSMVVWIKSKLMNISYREGLIADGK